MFPLGATNCDNQASLETGSTVNRLVQEQSSMHESCETIKW